MSFATLTGASLTPNPAAHDICEKKSHEGYLVTCHLLIGKLRLTTGYDFNAEVYNEGRAAEVQMSTTTDDNADTDSAALLKLSQLAVCVGFEYAKVSEYACVDKGGQVLYFDA